MDKLTDQDVEDIRRYVFDNSEGFPELEDLPARWRRLSKIFKPDGHPFVEAQKDALIQYYVDCSKTKRWAWEGLLRLLEETLPIRLTPMTATCWVPPLSRVKLGIGWSRGVARDAEQ